ncbi:uncharacterized protein C12orf29 homolog [Octopus bimaculoides]|uniref:uncharacterized protein C12orf29 homolog n=1 Tax=Octopus bimaculoides TaxID=37653 RepID=UPI0022E35B57|nr:uncharacterized protein C12orf29 homolog [Octopus bimaculoides]XP_052825154.1 uncharacterized protein C12orf29 homolog [Octopus bimaculoides]
MDKLCSVQSKLNCIFEIAVTNEPSSKHSNQLYMVSATDKLRPDAKGHNLETALLTEKVDGTCAYVAEFKDRPWLWARHDRKPKKSAEKEFRKFQNEQLDKDATFQWNFEQDFKPFPEHWIPATGVEVKDGVVYPDQNGHTPGWVPIDVNSKQYCWHLESVNLKQGTALLLKETENTALKICLVPLKDILNHTAELIGTSVNGNPYGLGSKKFPFHILIVHGSIKVSYTSEMKRENFLSWMKSDPNGAVEGIVWHCDDGALFKLHRFHLCTSLPWPLPKPALSNLRPVSIDLNVDLLDESDRENNMLNRLLEYNGHTFSSLIEMNTALFT